MQLDLPPAITESSELIRIVLALPPPIKEDAASMVCPDPPFIALREAKLVILLL